LGSSGNVVRKSSTGEEIQSDGEEGDENSPTKRRKSSVRICLTKLKINFNKNFEKIVKVTFF